MNDQTKARLRKIWVCPQCGRKFERRNQSHSCKLYPVKLHFNGKENSEELYKTLCEKMEQHIGIVNIESLECCIHFVSTYTFAAVRVLKEKLLIDFSLNNPLQSKRFFKIANLSRQRFLYHMEIKKKEEVDSELLAWLKMASDKEFEKATLD